MVGVAALAWAYRAARILSRYGRTEVSLTLPPPESAPELGTYPSRESLAARVFGFSFAGLLRSTLVVAAGFVGASLLSIASVLCLLTLRGVQQSTDQWFVFDELTLLGQPFHLLLGAPADASRFTWKA